MYISKKKMLHLADEVMHGLEKLDTKPEIKSVVQTNGYGDEAISSIRTLCTDAVDFYNNKQVQDDDKKGMHTSLRKKRHRLQKHVASMVQALRDVYEDDQAARETYGVANSPPARPDALKEYARTLYEKLAEAIEDEKLLPYGIDNENVQAGVTLISEIEDLSKKYKDLKSNKEFSTAERNRIFRKLKKVWKAFERKCRDLFYDTPHVLEGIIPVPSEGFKRRPAKTKPEDTETPEDPETPESPDSSETENNAADAGVSTETDKMSPVKGETKPERKEVVVNPRKGEMPHEEVFII